MEAEREDKKRRDELQEQERIKLEARQKKERERLVRKFLSLVWHLHCIVLFVET